MSIVSFLEGLGYRRIPLRRNAVGHFEAAGTLAGRAVRVLIDTGAASTVVSLALAREMGLSIAPVGRQGGGAGGVNLEIYEVVGAELLLDEAHPRPRGLYAMDLGHVNAALALKGTTPVEAILGADVFDAQAAVIDYDSSSLFLRDA